MNLRKISDSKDYTKYLRKKYNIEGIVGRSKALEAVLKRALMIAPLNVNVLVTGKTGTGKTQIAELIHKNSHRRNKTFVELNCAALPESLIENELFGSAAGGHSGAMRPITGKAEVARGGTLFLDEVGELPLSAQSKLLQFLESGVFYPLGSSKSVKSDIRIITATNVDIRKAIQSKKFRKDFFYRIDTYRIDMPALSERKEDIADLATYLCKESCKKHGLIEVSISHSIVNVLRDREWKGNIRELKHMIEVASIRASLDRKQEISTCHLFPDDNISNNQGVSTSNFREATKQFQYRFLKKKLEDQGWNISRTAKDASLSRTQLYNLINSLRLRREVQSLE